MTVEETGEILNLLTMAYPQFYRNYTKSERNDLKMFWASLFERDDVRLVRAAVRSYIDSDEKGFPPVPGQIRAKIRLIVGLNELSEAEAWGMVMDIINPPDENAPFRAYARGVNYTEESFYELPPLIQRVVHSPDQLRDWYHMDREKLGSVVASNFMRSYRDLAAKEREYNKLSDDVKHLLSEMGLGREALPQRREVLPDGKGDGFYGRRKFGVGSLPEVQEAAGFPEDEE